MDDSQQNDLIRSFVPYSSRPFTCASQLFSRWVQPAKRASKKPVSSTVENGGSSEPDLACSDEFISKLTNNISQQTFQNHTDPRQSDLRIETKSLMHGTKDLLDHQNVSAFCSELRRSYIEANSKLRAPPSLRIPIPHPLPNSSNPVQQEKNSIAIGAKPVMIDYMFATLEQHQGMAFDFDGNLLEFKGVEGGRIGGSYNEVNLKLKRHASGKAQSSRSSAIGHARPQSYLQAGQRQHQESEGTDNEADGFHHYVAPQFGIRSRNREPKQDTTKTEAPEEVASRSTLPYSDVHSFIRSALRLTSLASNPRPSVYTQPMGWRPGAVDYFKPIQKYDPGSDQNELDEDFEPDPSMAAKTVTDVTNERMNEWLGVKERERWRQREGSTIADLLRGSDEETEGEEGIEVLR
ncbi:MAG: hypothetical protein Q9157_006282 [Trypethelium eluteriae]